MSIVGINNYALADDLVELPRQLEIDLALSTLPETLRDEATIYVRDFDRTGIEHHMIPWFDLERMRIDGVQPETARETLRKRFS